MSKRAVVTLSLVLAGAFLSVPVAALAWHGNKTITGFSGTLSSPGTMTGNISIDNIPAGTAVTLVDAFGADANHFYQGIYAFKFTNCTGGTAPDGSETIGSSGAFPGGPPPTHSGAPTFTLGAHSTSMSCNYSITFSGTAPSVSITAVNNDVWMLSGITMQGAFAVTGTPNPVVPEAPVAILVPLTGLAVVGGALLVIRRRSAGTSPNSVT